MMEAMTDGATASLRMMMKSMGEVHPRSEPSYVMLSTNHCVMSTSPVIWVLFEGYNRYHDEIESADMNEDVHSLIKKVIKFLDLEKKKHVVPGNVDVYYQGSDVMSNTTVETLAGHWQKLSEFIKPGQQAAFFRMEIVDPISPGT